MGIPARDRKSKAGGNSQSVCAPFPPWGAPKTFVFDNC